MNPAKASTPVGIFLCGIVVIVTMMLCASLSYPAVRTVQAQDLTVMVRQAELTATAVAVRATGRAIAAATAAQRQVELDQLHDAQTRTAMEITVSAATAQYEAGQTQTPIAQTAVAGRATATGQAIANATGAAWATGTARATATQIAGTATAAPRETAEALAVQATADAQAAFARQTMLNQAKQAVIILGSLLLLALAAAAIVIMLRIVPHRATPKPVVIIENEGPAAQPAVDFAAEGANVYTDPRASMYVMDLLRQDRNHEHAS